MVLYMILRTLDHRVNTTRPQRQEKLVLLAARMASRGRGPPLDFFTWRKE